MVFASNGIKNYSNDNIVLSHAQARWRLILKRWLDERSDTLVSKKRTKAFVWKYYIRGVSTRPSVACAIGRVAICALYYLCLCQTAVDAKDPNLQK